MTSTGPLSGARILIVEDDYFIATDLALELGNHGAEVVGPVASIKGALELVNDGNHIDAASLDVNVAGERVFPVADALLAHNVPFILSTGYDAGVIPNIYRNAPRCEKPVDAKALVHALAILVERRNSI